MYETDCHNVLCCLTEIEVAVTKGYMKLLVRTVDTDVDVVAIATLNNIKPDKSVGGVWCRCAVLVAIHVIYLVLSF